ncbi:MAG: metallophosphoesterase [Planctomycetales bacterium]|jgi:alkaline phosphatase|nr:metallophosphoesterase [Planctomycetales bacterium]
MNTSSPSNQSRREFVSNGALVLAAAAGLGLQKSITAANASPSISLRIGLITDLHHADKPAAGSRFYRETIGKLNSADEEYQKTGLDFVVELGDLIDAADSVETELSYLRTINLEFSKLSTDRHYVLGNHCVDTLTKTEFLQEVGQKASYYSFDRVGFHFIVLDACFRNDGVPYGRKNSKWNDANIPPAELEWLREDLRSTKLPTIVFVHQRLDVTTDHGVTNCVDVRDVLKNSGQVLAVFQGHSHQNDLNDIDGIYYCTLVAMVEGSGLENSGASLLELHDDGTIHVTGFRKQKSYDW